MSYLIQSAAVSQTLTYTFKKMNKLSLLKRSCESKLSNSQPTHPLSPIPHPLPKRKKRKALRLTIVRSIALSSSATSQAGRGSLGNILVNGSEELKVQLTAIQILERIYNHNPSNPSNTKRIPCSQKKRYRKAKHTHKKQNETNQT